MSERKYDPLEIEPRWQAVWADERTWEVSNEGAPATGRGASGTEAEQTSSYVLEMLPVPERRAAHRPPEGLLGRRRDRPLPPPSGPTRAAPDGLRLVRPAGGEPRDQDGRPPARVHGRLDRLLPAPVPRVGHLDRLVARAGHARTELLPLDAVDLPAAVRGRAGLPQGGGGQVVPERPDGARQRAGLARRHVRALRRDSSKSASSSSGSCASPTTPSGCWTISIRSSGPSTSRRCSETGSGAARGRR